MLRSVAIFCGFVAVVLLVLHRLLAGGYVVRYLDSHPDPSFVPAADYYLGEGYYFFQNLPEAATYFIRVPERYPNSPRADDSFFSYLQCLDDDPNVPRDVLIRAYEKYLDQFPSSAHAVQVKNHMENLRTGAR